MKAKDFISIPIYGLLIGHFVFMCSVVLAELFGLEDASLFWFPAMIAGIVYRVWEVRESKKRSMKSVVLPSALGFIGGICFGAIGAVFDSPNFGILIGIAVGVFVGVNLRRNSSSAVSRDPPIAAENAGSVAPPRIERQIHSKVEEERSKVEARLSNQLIWIKSVAYGVVGGAIFGLAGWVLSVAVEVVSLGFFEDIAITGLFVGASFGTVTTALIVSAGLIAKRRLSAAEKLSAELADLSEKGPS